ncbi:zinc finger protein 62 homolog [Anopheles ziemanni]|uniref:zinc finger protein 62 homolog n=1 Tax=Anopheles coustani TaxID=139045 RepID=UPI00265AB9F4|nr:zinc finger protein 62 homolog [Anopheles coustani]XP_058171598.1 zinc finger protein 62 homolog [Anopheles ziemanni]
MAAGTRKPVEICRFCLNLDNLTPLSKLAKASFTIQDVEHFTGIQLSPEAKRLSAICDQCTAVVKNSVTFRTNCLKYDIFFKELFSSENKWNLMEDNSSEQSIEFLEDPKNSIETVLIKGEIDELVTISDEDEDNKNTEEIPKPIDGRESETNATVANVPTKKKKIFRHKPQLCGVCGKFIVNLTAHSRNHDKEKRYSCPQCPVKMSNETNLKRHIDTVHEKKIIINCEVCAIGFTHKNTYLSHMMSRHGIGKTYECEICNKQFKYYSTYNSHVNTWHKRVREFACLTCGMKFKARVDLKKHQRVHSSDKPYACERCPKRFKSSYARKIHQTTHDGVRFKCTMCEKSYSYKSLLSIHYKKDHSDQLIDASSV